MESVAVMAVRDARAKGVEVRVLRQRGAFDCWSARGRICDADMSRKVLERCTGISEDTARRLLGHRMTTRRSMGYWIAANRELFVRTGMLLPAPRDRGVPAAPEVRARLARRRSRVAALPADFARMLEAEDVFCDLSGLVPFTQWFDPEVGHTQVFLAGVSADLSPDPDPEESAQDWLAPELLLVERQGGRIGLDFMTYGCLRVLSDFDSVQALSAEYDPRVPE